MCGIFGYLHQDIIPDLERIDANTILQHRGPDDNGWLLFNDKATLLGRQSLPAEPARLILLHKRLSIIDNSPEARQPMACPKQRFFLLFNGEIYNYIELRQELEVAGYTFLTRTDSEVLLAAYMHWGRDALPKLSGMFAFVIFDRLARSLFIARDPIGIKPLYFLREPTRIIFASEIKSLLPFLSKKKINPISLFHYLRAGLTDFSDNTLFLSIQQLLPGHYVEISVNDFSFSTQCYWQPHCSIESSISFQEAAQQVKDIFFQQLQLHMRADTQIAATLSGGIDSSAIVMGIKHLYPDYTLPTFSYLADDNIINESKWIDIINHSAKIRSHYVYAEPDNLVRDFDHLIYLQDEPFGSTSIYAQARLFEMAKQVGVKVMLDGQGADEMLGGYTFYVAARCASLIKQGRLDQAVKLLFASRTHGASSLLMNILPYLFPAKYLNSIRNLMNKAIIPTWLNTSWFEPINLLTQLKPSYHRHVLQEELLHTFTCSSLPMLLRYADRNAMSHSIENRVPFLTTEFTNFVFSLPEQFIINTNGTTKSVFRAAMKGIVPDAVLARRDKIGFATPERQWLTRLEDYFTTILQSDYAKALPVFHYHSINTEWQELLSGKRCFDSRYWRWINFIRWSELHQIDYCQ